MKEKLRLIRFSQIRSRLFLDINTDTVEVRLLFGKCRIAWFLKSFSRELIDNFNKMFIKPILLLQND